MERLVLSILLLSFLLLFGCSSNLGNAGLGAVTGAAVGAAGYEYNAHHQMQQLEGEYRTGQIDRMEYEVRKKQIERSSLLK
jgi:hypothetical protein